MIEVPKGYEVVSQSLWAKEGPSIKAYHKGNVEEFLSHITDSGLRLFYGLKRIKKENNNENQ